MREGCVDEWRWHQSWVWSKRKINKQDECGVYDGFGREGRCGTLWREHGMNWNKWKEMYGNVKEEK